LPEPVVLVTNKGEILSVNHSFTNYFSPANEDLSGRSLFDLSATAPDKLLKFLQICSRSRQMIIGKLDLWNKDKQKKSYRCEGALLELGNENEPTIIFLRLQPKEKADIRFALLNRKIDKLNREILERKRAEQKNERLYKKALQASRLKDEFLATVSHELRTPLNSILGWTQILKSGDLGEATFHKGLETIERNTRIQVQLIEDILEVSRIITGKMKLNIQPVEIASIIGEAVDSVRPMAENKGVILDISLDPEVALIPADAKRIHQIVWNLISNAIKFTPKDGRVKVELQTVNSHTEIIVSDTGEGIPEDFLPHVFERFLQADASKTRKHGGLGLGLAIVRHLTELHGGTANVQSEGEGKGATFTISLPVPNLRNKQKSVLFAEENKIVPEKYKVALSSQSSLKNLHLLIVDDDKDARELLRLLLENYQAEVQTASSATEALEKFKEGNFQLLISDIAMPKEDGYSLIKKIRQLPKSSAGDIPAIALTAHAGKQDLSKAISKGFDVCLAKPFEPGELISLIEDLTSR
jgi:signal transduction histidine kinase/ActR/RegA family two-component response regulator